jgi:protein-tyrosine phosphatase
VYTDIHAHLLPGVDDGPETLEESLRVVDLMVEENISRIIITCHWDEKGPFGLALASFAKERKPLTMDQIKTLYEELTKAANEKYPDLKFYLGCEFYYTPGGVKGIKRGDIPTLAGTRYVLVEFNLASGYGPLREGIKNLLDAGYLPILAHTERYECLLKREDRLGELLKMGMYVQVNAKTLGKSNLNIRTQWAYRMIELGWVHLLATDTHNDDYRPPIMKEPVEKLQKFLTGFGSKKNPQQLDDILFRNPEKLLNNQYI